MQADSRVSRCLYARMYSSHKHNKIIFRLFLMYFYSPQLKLVGAIGIFE